MSSPRLGRKRANAAVSTPFLTLGGFAIMFGVLTASSLFVDALRAISLRFAAPSFLLLCALSTTFISAVFYDREKRRLP